MLSFHYNCKFWHQRILIFIKNGIYVGNNVWISKLIFRQFVGFFFILSVSYCFYRKYLERISPPFLSTLIFIIRDAQKDSNILQLFFHTWKSNIMLCVWYLLKYYICGCATSYTPITFPRVSNQNNKIQEKKNPTKDTFYTIVEFSLQL